MLVKKKTAVNHLTFDICDPELAIIKMNIEVEYAKSYSLQNARAGHQ